MPIHPPADDVAPHRLIGRKELLTLVPYSDVSIWRLERDGLFPRRITIGPNRVAWRLGEVLAWIDERAARSSSSHSLREPAQ
jgi:prophage regulatory protein